MSIDESIGWIKKSILDMRRTQICISDRTALETAIDIMRKYQKIEEIVKSWREVGLDYDSCDAIENIERVIEDGKID